MEGKTMAATQVGSQLRTVEKLLPALSGMFALSSISRPRSAGRAMMILVWIYLLVSFAAPASALDGQIEAFTPVGEADVDEIVRQIGHARESDSRKPHYKMTELSFRSSFGDNALSVVRIESRQCKDEFCPTVISYPSAPATRLIIFCAEWLYVSPNERETLMGERVQLAISVRTRSGLIHILPSSVGPIIEPG